MILDSVTVFPLLLASLGGLLSFRAGVLNISLEGCMGFGAFLAALCMTLGMPLVPALGCSVLGGCAAGLALAWVHVRGRANLFIAALGFNLLLPSLSSLVSTAVLGQAGSLPVRGPRILAESQILWFVLLLVVTGLMGYVMSRSRYGRYVRVSGTSPELLTERGIHVHRVQYSALILSSGLPALAGALIALRIGAYVPGISAGKGWIALVMIWLGYRRCAGILVACCLFSIAERFAGGLQGQSGLPATLFLAIPYLLALLFFVLSGSGKLTALLDPESG